VARPNIVGIHHLKIPVSDLDKSRIFYEKALGATRKEALDHRHASGELFAYIMDVPNLGTELELRLNAGAAQAMRGFDPVTLAVKGRSDLDEWIAHLSANEVRNSGMMVGYIGWLVAFEDPDGIRIRLYSLESHGPEVTPSTNPDWL
jgi:catechol 2,3-dioxygenase-like lactoylglutathione lyase family enzyme